MNKYRITVKLFKKYIHDNAIYTKHVDNEIISFIYLYNPINISKSDLFTYKQAYVHKIK